MEKAKKTRFVSGKIRDVTPREERSLRIVSLVLSIKIQVGVVAAVPAFLSPDRRKRDLVFSKMIADKIRRDHGEFLLENFVINANDWDGALINMRSFKNGVLEPPNSNRINLIKKIPGSNNFLLIAAEKQNGFFVVTHFETVTENGNELKSLLGRGDLIGPTGTPLGPADFLVASSPEAFLRGVSGSGDQDNISKSSKEINRKRL
ncbi:MAG: hypothetical protein WCO79_01300 [bacterium]